MVLNLSFKGWNQTTSLFGILIAIAVNFSPINGYGA